MEPAWLVWARELQAIAQTGLTFTTGTYDRERYTAIRSLAARMMVTHSDANFVRVERLFAEQAGYATPKVDVRGAVIEDGRILLVREIEDAGRWTVPGGWADVNQSPSESVIRELREESGLEVRVRKLAAVYDRARQGHTPPHPFHVYRLFFICDVVGGAPKAGLETSEVAFFGEDEIPEDLSVARVLPHQIARMFVEEVVVGLFKGKTIAESFPDIGGGGARGMFFMFIIISVLLVPFFAFREIGQVIGERELHSLIFTRRRSQYAGATAGER